MEENAEGGAGRPFPLRLAITLGVPLLCLVLADRIPNPGIRPEVLEEFGLTPNLSALALSLSSLVSAFVIVEILAALVPAWQSLRHDVADGRAKLRRASLALGFFFALMQTISTTLAAEEGELIVPGAKLVFGSTLVGGWIVQFLLAEWVSRQRIANGFVMLLGADLVWQAIAALRPLAPWAGSASGSELDAFHLKRQLPLVVFIGLVTALATGLMLRHAVGDRKQVGVAEGHPYRGAPTVGIAPRVSLPAGSYLAVSLSYALILALNYGLARANLLIESDVAWFVLRLTLALSLAWGFMRLSDGPREWARVLASLGLSKPEAYESVRQSEARPAFVTTVLFFGVVLIASTRRYDVVPFVVYLVAFGMDFAASISSRAWQCVWIDSRGLAISVIRGHLAADSIPTRLRGAHFGALFQMFAPYAPVEVLVAGTDRARARARIEELVERLREREDAESPAEGLREPSLVPSPRPAKALRTALGASMLLAALGPPLLKTWTNGPPPASVPMARLEVVRVDDGSDPLKNIKEEAIPEGSGIRLFTTNVPVGAGRHETRTYARMALQNGESREAGAKRFLSWLESFPRPSETRFALEDLEEATVEGGPMETVGLRSVLLTGEAVLTNADVLDATPGQDSGRNSYHVLISLAPSAARRFEEMTEQWTKRRLAILVDGQVRSAPVIQTRIAGGRVTITMGNTDPSQGFKEAKRLADGLRPR